MIERNQLLQVLSARVHRSSASMRSASASPSPSIERRVVNDCSGSRGRNTLAGLPAAITLLGDILSHYRARADNRVIADRHALTDDGAVANPDIAA